MSNKGAPDEIQAIIVVFLLITLPMNSINTKYRRLCQSASSSLQAGMTVTGNRMRGLLRALLLAALLGVLALVTGCAGTSLRDSVQPISEIPVQHRQEVVMTAMGLMGSPYRYGGTEPV